MNKVLRSNALSDFTCLGDKCEDTCCQTWSMQVDESTIERYRTQAPELLAAVESSKEVPWIMRKEGGNCGHCIKLDKGLCGIYNEYGEDFLGDACHFYPRVTRTLGGAVIMDASVSCPEVVRLSLFKDNSCDRHETTVNRLPDEVKDYLPEGIVAQDALAIHNAFIAAAMDMSVPMEEAFARIASVTRSIERVEKSTWIQATEFYFKNVGMWLPQMDENPLDPFNLLHALCGLIVATQKPRSDRLKDTLDEMEKALDVTLDWEQASIETSDISQQKLDMVRAEWANGGAEEYDTVLRRYLQMQLAESLFPFSGLGGTPSERITIIGVRLATIKLALMCSHAIHGKTLPEEVVVRVIQTISRILDHLADPAFSLQIYTETGWIHEGRMRSLLNV